MKDKDIVHYTRKTLPKGRANWTRLKNLSEKELEEATRNDADNPRWTKKMLKEATLNMPQKKTAVHMYLDQEIIEWFKAKGKGYQGRINSVLKSYVQKHL